MHLKVELRLDLCFDLILFRFWSKKFQQILYGGSHLTMKVRFEIFYLSVMKVTQN